MSVHVCVCMCVCICVCVCVCLSIPSQDDYAVYLISEPLHTDSALKGI